jgi:tetratricopeptide (TPR) repeat protein
MTGDHAMLGQLDEALVTGTRAASIASKLGNLRLCLLATTYLARVHFVRGEYDRVVELATGNVAALPSEWTYEYFGMASPLSIYDRHWLALSLAHVGKFAEANVRGTEAIELAKSTHRPHPISVAYPAAAVPHVIKGDWEMARSLMETMFGTQGARDVGVTANYFTLSAWILAQLGGAREALQGLREAEQRVEREQAKGGSSVYSAWNYHALGRACLLLGRLDDARRNADHAVETSSSQPGFAAYALHLIGDVVTHPDQFDPKSGETYYRQALALAEPRGMRPLVAHCHLGLGKHYRRTCRSEQAREWLNLATKKYREMDMTYWLGRAESELSQLR